MPLRAKVEIFAGRPTFVLNGRPTTEFWSYGMPNAISDFVAGDIRICQFDCHYPSFWTGPGQYEFAAIERQIDEFLRIAPNVLLIPRLQFGMQGEGWWSRLHPDQLSVGRRLDGTPVDYLQVRVRQEECWYSAGSDVFTRDASAAMAALVRHFEQRNGDHIVGYQVGGGISTEWFRWWTFIEDTYEDYSAPARAAFQAFLRARYATFERLRAAWDQPDVTFDTAAVPEPARLHRPQRGFLRDPHRERDILDWLECLSDLNADQLIALCRAARAACGGTKLIGAFYGYLWPHWNTQNPARSGHLALRRVFTSDALDYVSSPYHYDNRVLGGFHHSETLPQFVERCGKLHLDEIDTPTHLTPPRWPNELQGLPPGPDEASRLLVRDAAAILGEAGIGWWMDLYHSAWYADEPLRRTLRDVQALARQARGWSCTPRAGVAFVIDDASYAYADLRDNLNQYFTALPRQFEWSDLGFPIDTLLLSELDAVSDYRVYVFLNCWRIDATTRAVLDRRVRRPGVTAVWFYAAGYYADDHAGPDAMRAVVGCDFAVQTEPVVPEIDVLPTGHALLDEEQATPRGASRFGARLHPDRQRRLVTVNPRGWDTPVSPLFVPTDPAAAVLGRYVHDGRPGLVVRDGDGRRSIYCGAPMLPGWLLRRIAAAAGVHLYTPLGCAVHHRGPLVSVYAPKGGEVHVTPPSGRYAEITCRENAWRPTDPPLPPGGASYRFAPGETRFFLQQ